MSIIWKTNLVFGNQGTVSDFNVVEHSAAAYSHNNIFSIERTQYRPVKDLNVQVPLSYGDLYFLAVLLQDETCIKVIKNTIIDIFTSHNSNYIYSPGRSSFLSRKNCLMWFSQIVRKFNSFMKYIDVTDPYVLKRTVGDVHQTLTNKSLVLTQSSLSQNGTILDSISSFENLSNGKNHYEVLYDSWNKFSYFRALFEETNGKFVFAKKLYGRPAFWLRFPSLNGYTYGTQILFRVGFILLTKADDPNYLRAGIYIDSDGTWLDLDPAIHNYFQGIGTPRSITDYYMEHLKIEV